MLDLKTKIKRGVFVFSSLLVVTFFIFAVFSLFTPDLNLYEDSESIAVSDDVPQIEYVASVATGVQNANSVSTPKYFYFNKSAKESIKRIKISAESYIVGDLNTGEIILAKNAEKQFPIASVSKLMTAVVTDEIGKKEDIAKVSKRALATYGENGNFRVGEKIATSELVYPLLMESSNDAAEILAEHYGRDAFLSKMNLAAKKLKMSRTSYSDPSGLSAKNLSTVSDLFKLTGYVKQKKDNLLEITTKRSYKTKKHTWFNISQFLREPGYMGGKSGFTDPAKQTVISTFYLNLGKENSRPIAIALLRSNDRQRDVQTILKYIKKNIYYGGAKDAKADWIKERLDLPELREPDFVTMSFLGDIMLDRGVRSSVNKNFAGDYSSLFDKLEILKKSDIVFANLEGPASDKGEDMRNLYSFRMDPSVIPALKGAGISILSVANNHVGDWGRNAYVDTLARLKENEILYTGGGTKFEAENPTIIEKNGIKIGFLGFSDVGPNWMEARNKITDQGPIEEQGLLLANNPRFDEIVANASKQVDHLVVSFHFGDEYKTKNNSRQQFLAHKAVDAGAKIVIGHHPHVVQNTEIYKNSFIAYSLGNSIFDQKFSVATMEGMLLNLKIQKDGTMSVQKNTVKLNSVFQPDKIIFGKEEQVKFQVLKAQ
ncbi:MAG: CapA family protein [bacterium]|nr:CapA family protein [bacterium]